MYIKEGITIVESDEDIVKIVEELDKIPYDSRHYISFEELKEKFNYGGFPYAKVRN